jgi:protein-arginine kinase activator protein McsA
VRCSRCNKRKNITPLELISEHMRWSLALCDSCLADLQDEYHPIPKPLHRRRQFVVIDEDEIPSGDGDDR